MTLDFRVLGPVEASADGTAVPLSVGKPLIVLAGLLLRANQVVPVDVLTRWLWDGDEPASARGALQNYVSSVRHSLGEHDVIHTEPGGYRMIVADDAVDLARFRRLSRQGKQALDDGDGAAAAKRLEAALDQWRGTPMSNVDSPPMWRDEVPALEEQRLQAQEWWVDAMLSVGQHVAVIPELTKLAGAHPLRERLHEQLMLALFRAGRKGDALQVFGRITATLANELGLDPGAGLRHMQQVVLTDDDTLLAAPGAAASAGTVPHQLPLDLAGFSGRDHELKALRELVADEPNAHAGTAVAAIEGTAGVGKTSLAIHFAHQVAESFPDGQLYLNLRGYGPIDPTRPEDALQAMLQSVQVGEQLPADLDARAALWRSHTAGRRLLVLLDDARDSAQVRPLLPGPGSLVLVTSRAQLGGLAARQGAKRVTVEPFDVDGALGLLTSVLGAQTVRAERSAARQIVDLCGGLPLAIRILTERAAGGTSLAELVDELGGQRERLDMFDLGDGADTDLRAVFLPSYRALDAESAALFRLLGHSPGAGIGLGEAAALIGAPAGRTRRLIDRLLAAHLLNKRGYGRFELHALMREFAVDLSRHEDDEATVATAQRRVLDWYLHSTASAAHRLNPNRSLDPVPPVPDDVRPATFTSYQQALDWFDARYEDLLAVHRFAAEARLTPHAWLLPWVMSHYRHVRGHFDDGVESLETALALCQETGDRTAESFVLASLGVPYALRERYDKSIPIFERAVVVSREIGNRGREASTLINLSIGHGNVGHHDQAVHYGVQALDVAVAMGSRVREGFASRALGRAYLSLRHLDDAFAQLRRALAIGEELGYPDLQAMTLLDIGRAYREAGHFDEAITAYERAFEVNHGHGLRFDEGLVLTELGDLHRACGDDERARHYWERALTLLTELGHPSTEELRNKLANS